MPYRIVQIAKPFQHSGTHIVTQPCYNVEPSEYESPEEARKEIKSRAEGKYPYTHSTPEDWFIIIQTF